MNLELDALETSFDLIAPRGDELMDVFYARLFELDPSLRALFRGDMAEQGRKLMTMIAMAVSSLERLDTIVPAVRQLGARHNGYGVRDEHYVTVGAALLWTLEKGLGAEFTPEVRDAWTATYTLLANTMKSASPRDDAASGRMAGIATSWESGHTTTAAAPLAALLVRISTALSHQERGHHTERKPFTGLPLPAQEKNSCRGG